MHHFCIFFPKLAILHYKIVITLQMNFEFFNATKSTLSIFIQWFDRVGRFSDKEALAARSIEHYLMNSSFFFFFVIIHFWSTWKSNFPQFSMKERLIISSLYFVDCDSSVPQTLLNNSWRGLQKQNNVSCNPINIIFKRKSNSSLYSPASDIPQCSSLVLLGVTFQRVIASLGRMVILN